MRYVNLTPHKIEVYHSGQFINLAGDSKCYYADGIKGDPVLSLPSQGVARIAQAEERFDVKKGVPIYRMTYGELELPPDYTWKGEIIIVSLPTAIMAAAAGLSLSRHMVSPYGVVRSRENSSSILGCQGFMFS